MIEEFIDALQRNAWLEAAGTFVVLVLLGAATIWRARWDWCRIRGIARHLRKGAAMLGATYMGFTLTGRRPSLRGRYGGVPYVVDFPEIWKDFFKNFGNEPRYNLARMPRVFFRVTVLVRAPRRLSLRPANPAADLVQLGVPREGVWSREFQAHLQALFGNKGVEFMVTPNKTTAQFPIEWVAESVAPERVVAVVQATHAILAEVLKAEQASLPAAAPSTVRRLFGLA